MEDASVLLAQQIDDGIRETERANFHYHISNLAQAEKHGKRAIDIFSNVLKLYSDRLRARMLPLEVKGVQKVCQEAMNLFSVIKKHKGKNTYKISIDDKLKWLSSMINNELFPPIEENSVVYVNKWDRNFEDGIKGLSDNQLKHFSHWSHCEEIVGEGASAWPITERTKHDLSNLYQEDLLSTCSLVSSLISISNHDPRLVLDSIYPHSKSHKYLIIFHLNGCRRQILINDRLPVSNDSKITLFLKTFSNDNLYWPSLIEKAYFKIFGNNSYRFNGSNAGFDTYLLTGWIPEYIRTDEYFSNVENIDNFWDYIYKHFKVGNCLICVGTGEAFSKPRALTAVDGSKNTLVASHDYAIIDMKVSETGQRQLLIKNPWLFDSRQKFYDYNLVLDNFETLYLNWNPKIFKTCHRTKFLYTLKQDPTVIDSLAAYEKPQFSVSNTDTKETTAWLFLSEDITKFQANNDDARKSYHAKKLIIARTKDGRKTFTMSGGHIATQAIETTNMFNLVKVKLAPKEAVTVIIDMVPNPEHKSQKSVISLNIACYVESGGIRFSKAENYYPFYQLVESLWNVSTSGGNWFYSDYVLNPQYILDTLDRESSTNEVQLSLVLSIDSLDIFFNLQVFWYPETGLKGLQRFDSKKVIFNEKYTTKGELKIPNLKLSKNKKYLLLLSTYNPLSELGLRDLKYRLITQSSLVVKLTKVKNESLGLFTRSLKVLWNGENRCKVYFKASRNSTVNIRIKCNTDSDITSQMSRLSVTENDPPPNSSPINQMHTSYRPKIRANVFSDKTLKPVYHNNNFEDSLYGIYVNDLAIEEGAYVLLVERFEAGDGEMMILLGSDNKAEFLE